MTNPEDTRPRTKVRGGDGSGFEVGPFLARWGTWIAIAVMFGVHMTMVLRNIGAGVHEVLPAYVDMDVGSIDVWIDTIPRIFFKPDTILQSLRMYSLWIFFFLFLSVHGALRVGDSVPRGVLTLLSAGLAVIFLVLVATPAAWILFGESGPLAAELVPPIVLGGMAVLLEFSTRRLMAED